MASLTAAVKRRFIERGAYMDLSGSMYRVTRADNDTTITIRPVYGWRWLEGLLAKWESRVWWPVCDLLPIVRALATGKRWRLNDGRTLWPLWGYASRNRTGGLRATLPWWLGFYAKAPNRFADLYAVLPLVPCFWLWERWTYWRWCLENLGIKYGWFTVEDGDYFDEGRWAGIGEKFPT